jgi:hypothetical protein
MMPILTPPLDLLELEPETALSEVEVAVGALMRPEPAAVCALPW